MKTILQKRTQIYDLFIAQDQSFVIECFLKAEGGLKHLVYRSPNQPTVKQALFMTTKHGFLSRRPYQLAQACDGSIAAPATALFIHFCRAFNLEAETIYKLAYPNEALSKREQKSILSFAKWQGVSIPNIWNKTAFDGLLESLTEINNHSLISVLADLGIELN